MPLISLPFLNITARFSSGAELMQRTCHTCLSTGGHSKVGTGLRVSAKLPAQDSEPPQGQQTKRSTVAGGPRSITHGPSAGLLAPYWHILQL